MEDKFLVSGVEVGLMAASESLAEGKSEEAAGLPQLPPPWKDDIRPCLPPTALDLFQRKMFGWYIEISAEVKSLRVPSSE